MKLAQLFQWFACRTTIKDINFIWRDSLKSTFTYLKKELMSGVRYKLFMCAAMCIASSARILTMRMKSGNLRLANWCVAKSECPLMAGRILQRMNEC